MRGVADNLARVLSTMLIGLGIAVFARTAMEDHFSGLRLGYVVGPALVAAGLARLRLAAANRSHRDDEGGEV